MLLPEYLTELTIIVNRDKDQSLWRIVTVYPCANCGRAIMATDKYPGHYTHWGFDSTRCPDLDDGRDWTYLPKARRAQDPRVDPRVGYKHGHDHQFCSGCTTECEFGPCCVMG